ncbi:MAG: hypothetical protein II921_06935 [Treponema sp.]|nr:hypothetical protein [Treponema sp.]
MKKMVFLALIFSLFLRIVAAEQITINCLIDLSAPQKNYFSWTANGKNTKDSFDSVSGASKKHSTKDFKAAASKNGKSRLPKGIQNLLLFAVSHPDYIAKDTLSFSKNGKAAVITFIHRGNAYKIESDNTGAIDFYSSCFVQTNIADNKGGVFTVKDDFLKEAQNGAPSDAHNFSSVDWDALTLTPDTPQTSKEENLRGTLRATISGTALKINGTLTKADNEKKADSPSEQSLFGAIVEKIRGLTKKTQKKPKPTAEVTIESDGTSTESGSDTGGGEEEAEYQGEAGEESPQAQDGQPAESEDAQEIESSKIDDLLKKLDSLK